MFPGYAQVPVALVLLVIPVALLLATSTAVGPGRAAARVTPAAVLRSD